MGTATAGSALTKQIGGAFGLAWAQTLAGRQIQTGSAVSAAHAIGSTVVWTGGVAGLLACGVLLVTRGVTVPTPGGKETARRSAESRLAKAWGEGAEGRHVGPFC